MNKSEILTVIGISLIAIIPFWIFAVSPEIKKLPTDFYYYEEQIGINSLAPDYGELLSPPFMHHNVHEIKVVSNDKNILNIESRLQATNLDTGKVFLDETRTFYVDALTRSHLATEEGYFMFPQDTLQRDYFMTFPLAFTHATYTFEGIDVIQGLETYKFSCKSKPYDITNAISQFRDFLVFSFYRCTIWIEPVTGMHVDFLLEWESFFEENGQYTFLAEKGHKRTTPEYVTKLVAQVKSQKATYQILTIGVPIIFGLGSAAILSIPLFSSTKKERQLRIEKQIMIQREKQKDDFTSMISHELKTSLVPIKGYLDMILSGKFGSVNENIQEKLEIVKKSADSLHKLVNDLTDVQKIEHEQLRLNLSENYLTDLINETVIQLRPEFDKKRISIIQNLQNVKCVYDKTRIEQVLMNLLTNSIDFCPLNNGKITISLSSDDKYAKIIVEDNGVGIPQESIDKIFVKFYQVDSSMIREHGGTGLGLSIVRGIVEQHDGKIWAESKVGQGSTFTILLPKNSEQNILSDKKIGLKKSLDKI